MGGGGLKPSKTPLDPPIYMYCVSLNLMAIYNCFARTVIKVTTVYS